MIRGSLSKTALVTLALAAGVLTASCAVQRGSSPVEQPGGRAPEAAREGASQGLPEPSAEATARLEDAYLASLLQDDPELIPGESYTPSPHDELAEVALELSPDELERERKRVASLPPAFDIPMETNDRVLAWVDYYSNRHRDSFLPGLVRSGRHLERFREIFAEAGLPRDLVYMAHVESAYKTSAYSRARAKGIFQFIAGTARRYGMRIDYWVDERSDPEASARAAAAYLKDLYTEFGDWYLALAAYNAGEGKIRSALRRSGRKDFWGIARTRYIRRETRNYVPAILAAILISKQPHKYGFDFEPDPALRHDSVEIDGAADLRVLARCAGSDFETLRALNPALRRYQTPPDARTVVHVPVGTGGKTLAALEQIPPNERVLYARHKVRTGDTLSGLARSYGVTVRAIQQANRMGSRTMIHAGRTIVIPTVAAGDYEPLPATNVPTGQPLTYRVRRGDTLYGIARRYSTTAEAVAAASGIRVDKLLQIGERLRVVPGVRSSEEARRIASGEAAPATAGPSTHTVRRGDTLWRIAALYRTTVDSLCELNRISRETVLRPGDKLAVR